MGIFSRMPAPSKFSVAQWAAYLLPVAKAVFLGRLDLKDGLLKDVVESGIDLLGDDAKEKLTAFLKTKPDAVRDVLDQHLIRHTGAVLGRMVRRYSEEQTMEKYRLLLTEVAEEVPAAWIKYHASEEAGIQTLRGELFTQLALGVLVPGALAPQHNTAAIIAFFRWAAVEQNMLGPLMPGLTPAMSEWIAQNLSRQLLIELCQDTREGNAAWKESMLRLSVETHSKLDRMEQNQAITAAHAFGAHTGVQALQQQGDLILGQLADAIKANSAETRLAAYKRSLLSAFSAYQELALDNYTTADQACPDIWDIFVHPACSKQHLRPEDMDAAQMEQPPRLPAADLLPLLAQDDHRRTVLLADPGMGKSTLIQSLIAHLASGRPLAGAPTLNGLLPVPLILRDLVPLLPQDQVEGWTWDSLLTVLLKHYQREETAPLLCEAYQGHEAEFRQLLHNSDRIFFLIDGLDEIGDLVKRQKVVQCIHDGILAVSKATRWLITSRVIGYENANVHLIEGWCEFTYSQPDEPEVSNESSVAAVTSISLFEKRFTHQLGPEMRKIHELWKDCAIEFEVLAQDEGTSIEELRRTFCGWPGETLGHKYKYKLAQILYLAPFDNSRQDTFTSRWFRHRHSTDHSRELMREVRAHHHDGVRIISRVPNLLCMMNMLKRSGKPLPDGRAALYDEIVKAYLGGIDSAYKFKPIHGHTCPFEGSERRFLLSLLGAQMQQIRLGSEEGAKDGNILIAMPALMQLLLPAIEAMQQAGKVKSDHRAGELLSELLHHIASRSGLLIPRSSDAEGNTVYGFTHLSFMEFFAAEWLGKEFDRERNRNARRTEAADDGQTVNEADLDRDFPPLGPIEHRRTDFPLLAATPAWHEPLIFLLESRKSDAPTLLRWLFPALHVTPPKLGTSNLEPETPLLPIEAVKLAIQTAQDQELALSPATRQSWWRALWTAYLEWPRPPWSSNGWPIAALLLGDRLDRTEALQAILSIYPQPSSHEPQPVFPPLYLYMCDQLTTCDLAHLTGLAGLEFLDLGHCTRLQSLPDDLRNLVGLRRLVLQGCTGLNGVEAIRGLAELVGLEMLYLMDCRGLDYIPDLSSLSELLALDLSGCTGIRDPEALQGITGLVRLQSLALCSCVELQSLPSLSNLCALQELYLRDCKKLKSLPDLSSLQRLRALDLRGCTGLKNLKSLKSKLPPSCQVIGPDGNRL